MLTSVFILSPHLQKITDMLINKGFLEEIVIKIISYTQKKKFSQYLCFLIKSTILQISLSNCVHELYYRNFTCICLLCDK